MKKRKEIKRPWWYGALRGMQYYAFRYWAIFLSVFFLLLAVWFWLCYLPYLNDDKQCCSVKEYIQKIRSAEQALEDCCDCQLEHSKESNPRYTLDSSPQYTQDSIPKIPKANCRVHFSGALMGGVFDINGISEIYQEDNWSEYVGAGYYPRNSEAFPKAVKHTFDGIAIDRGTHLILYSQPNFAGEVLLDVRGPAIINNKIWVDDPMYDHCNTDNYPLNLQANYPQNVRRWSSSDMHNWSNGSCKIICE